MIESGTLVFVGQLAMVVALLFAPTLLFLGLLRGLRWLRNDAVIAEWRLETDADFDPAELDDVLGTLSRGLGIGSSDDSRSGSSMRDEHSVALEDVNQRR